MKRWLLGLWLLAGCATHIWAAGWADRWPRSGRIVFEVRQASSGLVIGNNEHRWEQDGTQWRLRSVVEPAGIVAMFSKARAVQESRGVFVAAGMQPVEFMTEKKGKKKDSARFDLSAGRVELGNGKILPFSVPTQDLLSLFYQLGALNLDGGSSTLFMTTGRKLKEYRVSAGRVERLDTQLGQRQARHAVITAASQPDEGERTEVWLDAQTHLPLRIRYRDRKGEVFDQRVTHMTIGDKR